MPPVRGSDLQRLRAPKLTQQNPARVAYVRRSSPELEFVGFADEGPDPATTDPIGSAAGWVAAKASAVADTLYDWGEQLIDAGRFAAMDIAGTASAAVTGEPPTMPGPAFEHATGLAESVNRLLPETVQKKLGTISESNIAGYITLPDGRRIPVPKAGNPADAAERLLTDAGKVALRKLDVDGAYNRERVRLETQKLAASQGQWAKTFDLATRRAELDFKTRELQNRALELALEEKLYSPAQRALWGRPIPLDPQARGTAERVRAIGPGVPGGIITTTRPYETELYR